MPYTLTHIVAALGIAASSPAPATPNWFDFSGDKAQTDDVNVALTEPTHAEGKDGRTRFEAAGKAIGHFIRMFREGRMSEDDAWRATKEWNAASLVPPWPEDRLRTDFDRLVEIDKREHGPIAAPLLPAQLAQTFAITGFRADKRIDEPVPPRRWVVEGIIPRGTAGVLAAVGDAGKSMMVLKLALDIAVTPPAADGIAISPRFFGGEVMSRGAAVILTCEENADDIEQRLAGLDPTKMRRGKPLYVVPMLSLGGPAAIIQGSRNGPEATPFWADVRRQLLEIPNLQLVVFDPLSSFVAGDTNDNAIGSRLMGMLGELAHATGAAVLVPHHFAKGSDTKINGLSDARNAVRGASAWVDNARFAIALWEADGQKAATVLNVIGDKRTRQAGVVYFGGKTKGNAPGAKERRTFVRNMSTGLLEDVTDQLQRSMPKRDEIDDQVFKALHALRMEIDTLKIVPGKNALERSGVWALVRKHMAIGIRPLSDSIDRLIASGQLIRTNYTDKTASYEPKT